MRHFQREIDRLKQEILSLSAMAEESIQKSVLSLTRRDAKLAREVIDNDTRINQKEVEIEEDCLKILSLYQPVAKDLRFIVAILKMTSDLERIGDLGVNIAERAVFLARHRPVDIPIDFTGMTRRVQTMLKRCLDALIQRDSGSARQVLALDDDVDAMNREMFVEIQKEIRKDPSRMESLIHLLSASRHLERVADHATNIAEDVIYMVEGEIVRHKAEDFQPLISGDS